MISVIVPYKDAELWLGRCCESMQKNKGDFEFILVNDNSSDGGPAIASSYAALDDRFRTIDNQRGPGVSGARNTGLDAAKGDWITFLDADDEMLPGVYKAMTTEAETGANIYQFNHLRYYTSKQKLSRKYTNEGGIYRLPILPDVWYGVWNKLFRAEFVQDIRFNESMQYGEDGLFVLECLAKDGRIHHAPRPIVTVKHRFDNPESLSHIKTFEEMIGQTRVYEEFLLRQTDPDLKLAICLDMERLWRRIAKRIK